MAQVEVDSGAFLRFLRALEPSEAQAQAQAQAQAGAPQASPDKAAVEVVGIVLEAIAADQEARMGLVDGAEVNCQNPTKHTQPLNSHILSRTLTATCRFLSARHRFASPPVPSELLHAMLGALCRLADTRNDQARFHALPLLAQLVAPVAREVVEEDSVPSLLRAQLCLLVDRCDELVTQARATAPQLLGIAPPVVLAQGAGPQALGSDEGVVGASDVAALKAKLLADSSAFGALVQSHLVPVLASFQDRPSRQWTPQLLDCFESCVVQDVAGRFGEAVQRVDGLCAGLGDEGSTLAFEAMLELVSGCVRHAPLQLDDLLSTFLPRVVPLCTSLVADGSGAEQPDGPQQQQQQQRRSGVLVGTVLQMCTSSLVLRPADWTCAGTAGFVDLLFGAFGLEGFSGDKVNAGVREVMDEQPSELRWRVALGASRFAHMGIHQGMMLDTPANLPKHMRGLTVLAGAVEIAALCVSARAMEECPLLLDAACELAAQGRDVTFLFKTVMPSTVRSVSQLCEGDEALKTQTVRFMARAWCALVENRINVMQAFVPITVKLPEFVSSLSSSSSSPSERCAVMCDLFGIAVECAQKGQPIQLLVGDGLNTALRISEGSGEAARELFQQMTQLLKGDGDTLLMLLSSALEFCEQLLAEEERGVARVRAMVRGMVKRGQKKDIRMLFAICTQFHQHPALRSIWRVILHHGDAGVAWLPRPLFLSALRVMAAIREASGNQPHELEGNAALVSVVGLVIAAAESDLERVGDAAAKALSTPPDGQVVEGGLWRSGEDLGQFTEQLVQGICQRLSQVSLFRVLSMFPPESDGQEKPEDSGEGGLQGEGKGEEGQRGHGDNESAPAAPAAPSAELDAMFPKEVVGSDEVMQLLLTLGSRLEQSRLQKPGKYAHLHRVAARAVRVFLSRSKGDEGGPETSLEQRFQALHEFVVSLPFNEPRIEHLKECGYSPALWEGKPLSVHLRTPGSLAALERYRVSLLGCVQRYAEVLLTAGVKELDVGGTKEQISLKWCTGEASVLLGVEELQVRRAAAVRALQGVYDEAITSKKSALIEQEEKIEAEYQQDAQQPQDTKHYRAHILMGLLETAGSCGSQIEGCYAFDGIHGEKPVEVGLRSDQGFISIVDDELGREVESVEFALTDQGMYLFKAYTDGHMRDTSLLWAAVVKELLTQSIVPRVILSHNMPKPTAFQHVRSFVGTSPSTALLTFQADCFDDHASYFDHKPEKVVGGVDVVVTRESAAAIELPQFLRRQSSLSSLSSHSIASPLELKDLATVIRDALVEVMMGDQRLAVFVVLGRALLQYITQLIQTAKSQPEIIDVGLNLDKWNRRKGGKKKQKAKPLPQLSLEEKAEVIQALVKLVHDVILDSLTDADPDMLFSTNREHFFELRGFVLRLVSLEDAADAGWAPQVVLQARALESKMRATVLRSIRFVRLTSLVAAKQQAVMQWIFRNEDRVWRHRGGRPEYETPQQFLSFLQPPDTSEWEPPRRAGKPVSPFPGIVVLSSAPSTKSDGKLSCRTDSIVGYVCGEYVRWSCYEAVAAWVDPQYTRLTIATKMYTLVMRAVPCKTIKFDVLSGSLNSIGLRSPVFRALQRLKLDRVLIREVDSPRSSPVDGGTAEVFRQYEISASLIRPLLVAFSRSTLL